jgi:hypothetical protein
MSKTTKPSKQEIANALEILLKWATGSDRSGNPYCDRPVKYALSVLARQKGLPAAAKFAVEVRDLPIPEHA